MQCADLNQLALKSIIDRLQVQHTRSAHRDDSTVTISSPQDSVHSQPTTETNQNPEALRNNLQSTGRNTTEPERKAEPNETAASPTSVYRSWWRR
ncbi:hypothetical protein M3Y94_00185600 [Aphelenchoides besseyi]|nr:hypothetical protein M3Y94_00185600 [Aphelenchoides besseyi]KAI6236844.1 hypothetical protein M3Y95_00201700 [Aphelenchoides besseyi]